MVLRLYLNMQIDFSCQMKSQLLSRNLTNRHRSSYPRKRVSSVYYHHMKFLDSRLCGNDGGKT
jgi:hypothetical protein